MEPYIIISENNILNFLAFGAGVNFYIGYFRPLQPYRFQLTHWLSNLIVRKRWFYLAPFLTAINCVKCLAFWGGFIIYQDIRLAMLMSIYAYLLERVLNAGNYVGAEGGDSK